jgi:hypothetical protein
VAYPDKGEMGLARHKGEVRLGLSATVASVVLYSAIVLFGVGSASPSATDATRDPHASDVLIQPHADTVSGSVQRLPQASPEPRRHGGRVPRPRTRSGVAPAPTSPAAPSPTAVADPTPAPPRVTESEPPSATGSTTAPVAEPLPPTSLPVISVPSVTVPVPVPVLQAPLPDPPASLPLPLPLP